MNIKDTNRDFSKEMEIINTCQLSHKVLAQQIGVNSSTFSEKIHGQRGSRFTDEQKDIIRNYLKELSNNIKKILK